jgi:act minimal PKS acyl carrier protein
VAQIEMSDLARTLRECGGDEIGTVTDDQLDVALGDLGYDSLSVLQLASRVKQRYAVAIPDSMVTTELTPRQVMDLVNALVERS